MQLNSFDGGLSTRRDSHLIGVNEARVYLNIDNEGGALSPVKQKQSTGINLLEFAHFFTVTQDWVSGVQNRDYLEYRNTLYFTEAGSVPMKTTDGINFFSLGTVNPLAAPGVSVGGAGGLIGTYQYVMTFFNSSDGSESGPTAVSDEVIAASNFIQLLGLQLSADLQVDQKKIYRIGGELTQFSLVATIPAAQTSFVDAAADIDIPGDLLQTQLYAPAPSGLSFLTEHYGVFIGALGDKVFFTLVAIPDAWPVLNFIDFDSDVTGIGRVLSGIVVFTRTHSYLITGTNVNSFVKAVISSTQGCREHKTVQEITNNGQLLWVSDDGVCSTTGSSVQLVTKDKLGKLDLSTANAVVHDEVYYVQLLDRTILAIDTRYGVIMKHLSLGTTRLVTANDTLFAVDANELFTLFSSSLNEMCTYLSPNFTEGSYTNRKAYKHFYIRANGSFTVSILVDGVSVLTKTLSGLETHDLVIPQDLQNGYSLQLSIIGTAVIYEIEWKALARRTN